MLEIADQIVFNLGQDAYVKALPLEIRKKVLNVALEMYAELIKDEPDSIAATAHISRGRAYLYSGELDEALADFSQANALNPKDAYSALWLDIANRRSKQKSLLPEASKEIDMTKWPAPVIRFFLEFPATGAIGPTGPQGLQLKEEDLLMAASAADPNTTRNQLCDAYFFSGEFVLLQGNKDEATRLFQLAATDCPNNNVNRTPAEMRLTELTSAGR
jgi:lipoprotein NlpI